MSSPQVQYAKKRKARGGVAVAVILDPALEPDAIIRWNDLRARYGGQKPAFLWLLRNVEDKQQ